MRFFFTLTSAITFAIALAVVIGCATFLISSDDQVVARSVTLDTQTDDMSDIDSPTMGALE